MWTVFVFFTLLGSSESSEIKKRVVSGMNVGAGQRQFFVQVCRNTDLKKCVSGNKEEKGEARCGGAIIHENLVVTAASCVENHNNQTFVFVKDFTKPAETEEKIGAFVIRDKRQKSLVYNKDAEIGDIAVLALYEHKTKLDSRKIRLCHEIEGKPSKVSVCGMGLDRIVQPGGKKEFPERLQEASMLEVKCAEPSGEPCRLVVLEKGKQHQSICLGDTGGPAYELDKKNEPICLYAVAGHVERTDKCPSQTNFARVSFYNENFISPCEKTADKGFKAVLKGCKNN